MKLSKRRVWAITLRHIFALRRSLDRLTDAFYWPSVDIIIWGLTISALQKQGESEIIQIVAIITGVVLWYIVWRGQAELTVGVLEELWSENLSNLFSTPLSVYEWVLGILSIGFIKLIFTTLFVSGVAYFLYAVNIMSMGFVFVPLSLSLLFTGYAFGFFVAGLFLRFGTTIQTLAWAGAFILMPFSGTYYPLATLPIWVQRVAAFVPSSYVFEGMRAVVFDGVFPTDMIIKSYVLNVVYFIFGLLFFISSFNHARKQGIAHLK